MSNLQLKNRCSGDVIFEGKFGSVKELVLAAIEAKKDLSYADLRYADLRSADLRYADLRYADLRSANLSYADLSYADLRYANLSYADLRSADLSYADLSYADLRYANLSSADLSYADLRSADLRSADLRSANLSYANLSYANLRSADLRSANLSGLTGLLNSIDWLTKNGEKHKEGLIFYKTFGGQYAPNKEWKIKRGFEIHEVCNPLPTCDCGSGINIGTKEWVNSNYLNGDLYKILIKWEWMAGVVVPYNTDGKIRCSRAKIISKVKR